MTDLNRILQISIISNMYNDKYINIKDNEKGVIVKIETKNLKYSDKLIDKIRRNLNSLKTSEEYKIRYPSLANNDYLIFKKENLNGENMDSKICIYCYSNDLEYKKALEAKLVSELEVITVLQKGILDKKSKLVELTSEINNLNILDEADIGETKLAEKDLEDELDSFQR